MSNGSKNIQTECLELKNARWEEMFKTNLEKVKYKKCPFERISLMPGGRRCLKPMK